MDKDNDLQPMHQQKTPVVDYNSVKQNEDASSSKNENKKDEVRQAHEQADADIAKDADLSIHSPNDDLDEGETARLGEETDLV